MLFRWLRIAVLLLILALLSAGTYLNRIGLPDFLKRPLVEKLRARGVDLEFARLRLRWYRGIVAENVRFGRAEATNSPRFTLREVEVRLNHQALARLQLQVDSLALSHGRLVWPIAQANQASRALTVDDITAQLRFVPNDEWALDDFHANFAGVRFELAGNVTNASSVRDWPFLRTKQPAPSAFWQERLRRFADALEQIHFVSPPDLRLAVSGDARDLQSFTVRLALNAPGAETPWGKLNHGYLTARLFPATSNGFSRVELSLKAADMQTQWANASELDSTLRLVSTAGQTNVVDADLSLQAASVKTPRADTTNVEFTAHWIHSLTNAIPLSGNGDLRAATAFTRWGRVKDLQLAAHLATPTNVSPANASWAWWTNIQSYALDWECRLTQFQSEKINGGRILCTGAWRSPELAITALHAELYSGALDAKAHLDVGTRAASFNLASDFDVQKISPLLTERARIWLATFSWSQPPKLTGSGSGILPAWTNRQPDWRENIEPTLRLDGEFQAAGGAYRGVSVSSARSHFSYSNMCWRLPDLIVQRPEGRLELAYQENDRTKDYHWRIRGTFDPRALRPLLSTNELRGLDYFTFISPPVLDGEMWGRFFEYDCIGFRTRVVLTNFTFRGESASSLETSVGYTNRFLEFIEPRLLRGTQVVTAAGVGVDFKAQRAYITNGFSDTDPQTVARAIGPKVGHALEPYRFTQPPLAHVNGYAPLKGSRDADLRIDVDGGPFEWWKFKIPRISGDVHWLGEHVVLTNVQAAFYGGAAAGSAGFDFTPEKPGTDFRLAAVVTNMDLQQLMGDLSTRTNHLEGRVSGELLITNANSTDWRTVDGRGRVQLRDGLIWEIPIFGLLSPVLDSIVPGLGSSRVNEGSARFIITNGVIYSDTLEMRSPTMRLEYAGAVDLQQRVDARVTAELLRDTWVVGRVISLALWPVSKLFEYKITGTLAQPKSDPVYMLPKLLLLPLHPIRTVEGLFPGELSSTNAPPTSSEPPEK
jgi:hypothetical protein